MSTSRTPIRAIVAARRRARGFTLLELLIAMTAGLFVSIAAYAMARQGARFFQQEARIANAQYAMTLGFDRLRQDVSRAAFLSTPNITADKRVCGDPGTWISELVNLKTLSAVRLEQKGSPAGQDDTNGVHPDRIVLSGSYASAEMFPIADIAQVSNKYDIYLQTEPGPMVRASGGQVTDDSLVDLFRAGRAMRILDEAGRYEFGVIDGFRVTDGIPIVTLAADPPLPYKRSVADPCGIHGHCTGCQASVISWIAYELRDLHSSPGAYAPLFDSDPATAYAADSSRLELVRYEQDAKGGEMSSTLELVSEYAIDLKFGYTVLKPGIADPGKADIERYDFDDTKNAGVAPDDIRSVRVRLAVRSREADRQEAIALTSNNPYGNLYRYQIPNMLPAVYARARTVTGEVQLLNLAGSAWK